MATLSAVEQAKQDGTVAQPPTLAPATPPAPQDGPTASELSGFLASGE